MTRLSNLQFPVLERFASRIYISVQDAQKIDQRPFRSFLVRKFVAYKPGRGFHITPEGMNAYEAFRNTSYARKCYWAPLTKYFDYNAYGLRLVKPAKSAAA